MIRFPEIWERYKRGELKRLAPQEITFKKTQYYDIDSSSETIAQITSFQTAPLLKQLQKLSPEKPSMNTLEEILEPIEGIEQQITKKTNLFELYGHFIRAIELGHTYDLFIINAEKINYAQFNSRYKTLKKIRNKTIIQKKRESVNKIHEIVVGLHQLAKRRAITDEIPYANKHSVSEYLYIRNEINKIKGDIARINEEYEYADLLSKKGRKDMQELQREIKHFWNKGLITDANKVGYIEGKYELKKLHKKLKDARKHPKEYEIQRKVQLANKQAHEKRTVLQKTKDTQTTTSKEQNKVSVQETRTSPTTTIPSSRETYSLTMHLYGMGYPKNFQYFPLRDALLEHDSWSSRFNRFNQYLQELSSPKQQQEMSFEDKQYLKLISEGINLSLQKPEEDFPTKIARKTYNTLQTLIS